ncbi:MAG TPA: glycerol kinase GlpK [Candidatus Thermoplasmatota archaeon]|nr:glycerol kinase GlpK [Candidatus Thermoplasmatota archaeon]
MAVLAIDEGTTGVTALVLDDRRNVVGRAYAEVPQTYPQPGWVEQDATQVLDTVKVVGRAALRAAKLQARDLAAVGITNQRETTVLWDRKTGVPVLPAIVWQDRRTARRCQALRHEWESHVRRRTGLVLDPYFSATKVEWLLDRKGLRTRAKKGEVAFGTIDSWLAFRLTGRHATDPSNASRTMLWDIRRSDWDSDLLDLFGIPEEVLPQVSPSSAGIIGATRAFGGSIPLASLVGDQQSALFGQGCTKAGEAKTTYGTGCFLLQHTGGKAVRSRHGLIATRAASVDARPRFALEGSVFTAGAAIQWLRDQLGLVASAPEVDALAAQVPDTAGVQVVPAFTGLGAPHWDADARGAILGLTRGADRRHIARAVLESIALQSTEVLLAMQKDSGHALPRLRVDGGAARSDLLLQMQADLLQRPVVRPANVETTAMGAGLLAGLATDQWTMADVRSRHPGDVTVRPRAPAKSARARMAAWALAVAATRSYNPQS